MLWTTVVAAHAGRLGRRSLSLIYCRTRGVLLSTAILSWRARRRKVSPNEREPYLVALKSGFTSYTYIAGVLREFKYYFVVDKNCFSIYLPKQT